MNEVDEKLKSLSQEEKIEYILKDLMKKVLDFGEVMAPSEHQFSSFKKLVFENFAKTTNDLKNTIIKTERGKENG